MPRDLIEKAAATKLCKPDVAPILQSLSKGWIGRSLSHLTTLQTKTRAKARGHLFFSFLAFLALTLSRFFSRSPSFKNNIVQVGPFGAVARAIAFEAELQSNSGLAGIGGKIKIGKIPTG